MNLLSGTYIFYADVYFVQNLLIKLTILFLITLGLGKRIFISLYRIAMIALVSTCMELIGLCVMPNYSLFVLTVHLFEVPGMVVFLVWKKWSLVPKGVISGYFFTMLVNASVEVLWNSFGNSISYFMILVIACGIVILGVAYYFKQNKNNKGVYFIELKYDGKVVEANAFYDSGNCLKDPYTNKGVHIVSEKIIKVFEKNIKHSVLIPYRTLSEEAGLMKVIYIDEIVIYRKNDILKQQKTPIGVAKEEVFRNKSYEMILNEEVF